MWRTTSQFEDEPTVRDGKESPDERGRKRRESNTRVGPSGHSDSAPDVLLI